MLVTKYLLKYGNEVMMSTLISCKIKINVSMETKLINNNNSKAKIWTKIKNSTNKGYIKKKRKDKCV